MASYKQFQNICHHLFGNSAEDGSLPGFDLGRQLSGGSEKGADIARQLNAAFLVLLAGTAHQQYENARVQLMRAADTGDWAHISQFYLAAKQQIEQEISKICNQDPDFADRLDSLAGFLGERDQRKSSPEIIEKIWSVFYPEAVGITANRSERINRLRKKKKGDDQPPESSTDHRFRARNYIHLQCSADPSR